MIMPDNSIPLPIHTLMQQISGIYGPERRWSDYEIGLLAEICRHETCFDESNLICKFSRTLKPGSKLFPMSVARLLENWNCVCDRSRLAIKPIGRQPDPVIVKEQKVLAEMALLRARSFNEETRLWLTDDRAVKDRARFNELRGVV